MTISLEPDANPQEAGMIGTHWRGRARRAAALALALLALLALAAGPALADDHGEEHHGEKHGEIQE